MNKLNVSKRALTNGIEGIKNNISLSIADAGVDIAIRHFDITTEMFTSTYIINAYLVHAFSTEEGTIDSDKKFIMYIPTKNLYDSSGNLFFILNGKDRVTYNNEDYYIRNIDYIGIHGVTNLLENSIYITAKLIQADKLKHNAFSRLD